MANAFTRSVLIAFALAPLGCATSAGVNDAFAGAGGSAVYGGPSDNAGASGAADNASSGGGAAGAVNDPGGAAGATQSNGGAAGAAPGGGGNNPGSGGASNAPLVPQSCTQTNNSVGCCSTQSDLYYCTTSGAAPQHQACATGQVCGWDATNSWYGCVAAPTGSDPTGTYPMACGS